MVLKNVPAVLVRSLRHFYSPVLLELLQSFNITAVQLGWYDLVHSSSLLAVEGIVGAVSIVVHVVCSYVPSYFVVFIQPL